eukprot:scaffold25678_cov137-Cylindrotheca_fusiformis.AAC.2
MIPMSDNEKLQRCLIVLFSFFSLIFVVDGGNLRRKQQNFADQFPSLDDTLNMAKLSKLVYHFRHENDTYCQNYSSADGVKCEWYMHNYELGTQVMIVSNRKHRYVAVVFAGTDDIRTSLEDVNVGQKPFGNNSTIYLNDSIRVHSGFDNAVFLKGVWDEISSRMKRLLLTHPFARIFTTGHSLGAANSVLTATALSLEGHSVSSINFGCPKTGNEEWRQYFNSTSPLKSKLRIWRVVLGWDLIPRLPDLFYHAGHTIQIWEVKTKGTNSSLQVEAYYEHYGDSSQDYAGAPSGWNAKPHFIAPGALMSHFMSKYLDHVDDLHRMKVWIDDFKKEEYDPIIYDDDEYVNPPDDLYQLEYETIPMEKEVRRVETA